MSISNINININIILYRVINSHRFSKIPSSLDIYIIYNSGLIKIILDNLPIATSKKFASNVLVDGNVICSQSIE